MIYCCTSIDPPPAFLYIDDLVVNQWYSILKKMSGRVKHAFKKIKPFLKIWIIYVKGKILLSWLLIGVIFRFINFFFALLTSPKNLRLLWFLMSSVHLKKGLLIEWNNKWQYAYIIYSTQNLAFRSDMTKTEIYL